MTSLTQSYHCGLADSPILYQTIGRYLDTIAKRYPDNEALVVCHQSVRWTYRKFNCEVDRLAKGLLALGIRPGDRVGIWGPNSYEWTLVQFATAKIGAILVCVNPAYGLYDLEYALNKVGCKLLVCAEQFKHSNYLAMLLELIPELEGYDPQSLKTEKLPELKMIVRMGKGHSAGMLNFEHVCGLGGEVETRELELITHQLQPDDAINIQFTSGTTGSPKGATLSHTNILNNGYLSGQGMGFTDQDRLCIPVPLYHCFGMVLGNLACIAHGATIVYPNDAFDPLTTLEVVQRERCTALHGVPTMFISELDHPKFHEFDLSSLRTGIMAGAPCPVEIMKRVIADMHMSDVLIGYGQTEVSPLNHLTLPEDPIEKRVETVGRAVPWVEIKLVDSDGRIVATGEKGEICTRGYSVMKGYWNDKQKTDETIDDAHWLHSGDLGTMDSEGYVRVVGRIKDMIIRGGENIYPREVEEFLYRHPKVSEVQVFGVGDDRLGEEVCAWVQVISGETLNEDELRNFCKGKIAHFKIPRYVQFVDHYPMTVTGKIQKFVMREKMTKILNTAPDAMPV